LLLGLPTNLIFNDNDDGDGNDFTNSLNNRNSSVDSDKKYKIKKQIIPMSDKTTCSNDKHNAT